MGRGCLTQACCSHSPPGSSSLPTHMGVAHRPEDASTSPSSCPHLLLEPWHALSTPPHSSKNPPCHLLPHLPTHVLPELLPFSRSCDDCTFLLLFYPKPQGSVFLILCLILVSSTVPGLTQKLFAECMQLARETLHKKSSEVLDNEEAGSIKVLSEHGALIKDRVVGDWRGLLQQCGGTLGRHRASLLM